MSRKKKIDPHLGCFAWPNCDEDPNGCSLLMGSEVESYGHKDSSETTKVHNWINLTDQEIFDIWDKQQGLLLKARAIEAAIKDKNIWFVSTPKGSLK